MKIIKKSRKLLNFNEKSKFSDFERIFENFSEKKNRGVWGAEPPSNARIRVAWLVAYLEAQIITYYIPRGHTSCNCNKYLFF